MGSDASRVYLDWNATTPPVKEVLDAMTSAAQEGWANPASIHGHGRAARRFVEDARASVAALAGVDARDVILTSGGTEANNLALRSAFAGTQDGVLVTSRLEHPSVTRVAEALEREGRAQVHWLRVLPEGRADLDDLAAVLRTRNVRLVALQSANHETGILQPLDEACGLAKAHGVAVHADVVQSWGRLEGLGAEARTRSLAAHKLRGPKGIGALICHVGVRIEPVLLGGAQEKGLRPGTVDPMAAAGLGAAARRAAQGPARYEAVKLLRDKLEGELLEIGAEVNGRGPRAPHVSNLAFPSWNGPELVAALDLEGVSVSSGSACSAGTIEPSPVLTAMAGVPRAACSLRISLGEETTAEDIERACVAFRTVLGR